MWGTWLVDESRIRPAAAREKGGSEGGEMVRK